MQKQLKAKLPIIRNLFFLIIFAFIFNSCEQKEKEKPNVLFVSIDDLNDWVEPLGGHPQVKTQNLASFAEEALTFTNAHASSPLCNPSRVSLLTGLDPRNTGIVSNNAFYPFREHLPEAETMIQHFKRDGYYTAGLGKIFHKNDSKTEPWDEYSWCSGRPKPKPFPGHGVPFLTDSVYRYFDWGIVEDTITKWGENKASTKAVEFLDRGHEQPFFLAVGFRLPHLAWYTRPEFHKMYDDLEIELPTFKVDDLADVSPEAVKAIRKAIQAHDTIMARNIWKDAVKSYLVAASYVDFELGKILDKLKATSYEENTIVVIWGDHGFHLGEKLHWRKNTLWEEATRVPLFIHVPGKTESAVRTDQPVSLLDLYPTLVNLCQLTPRDDLDGQVISKLFDNPKAELNRKYVTTTNVLGTAVRTTDFRYIRYLDGFEELYDHNMDSLEHKNLVMDKEYAAKLAQMRSLLND